MNGILTIEVQGTTPGTGFDRLTAFGPATLAGELHVITTGFTPVLGDVFTFVSASSRTGTFGTVDFTGATYDLSYGASGATLVAKRATTTDVACLPGAPAVSQATNCTATITDVDAGSPSAPTGDVSFDNVGTGAFGSGGVCTLASVSATASSCSLTYTPTTGGTHHVSAQYEGDSTHSGGLDTAVLNVGGGGGGGDTTTTADDTGVDFPPTEDAPVLVQPVVAEPQANKTGNVSRVDGTVFALLFATTRPVRIETLATIPEGTLIDTRTGTVELTVADGKGGFQKGRFSGGIFRFGQHFEIVGGKRTLITDIKLIQSGYAVCGKDLALPPPPRRGRALAGPSRRRVIRFLNAQATGKFNVIGRQASGLERGTNWTTTDTCEATEVKVIEGTVVVTDFVKRKKFNVRAGKTYIAKGRRPRR